MGEKARRRINFLEGAKNLTSLGGYASGIAVYIEVGLIKEKLNDARQILSVADTFFRQNPDQSIINNQYYLQNLFDQVTAAKHSAVVFSHNAEGFLIASAAFTLLAVALFGIQLYKDSRLPVPVAT